MPEHVHALGDAVAPHGPRRGQERQVGQVVPVADQAGQEADAEADAQPGADPGGECRCAQGEVNAASVGTGRAPHRVSTANQRPSCSSRCVTSSPASAASASTASGPTWAQGNGRDRLQAGDQVRVVTADAGPGLGEVADHPPRRGAAARAPRRSSRTGAPPMPMLPSASSTVSQRPSPGSGSNTLRRRAGDAAPPGLLHRLVHDVDAQHDVPGRREVGAHPAGPQPTSRVAPRQCPSSTRSAWLTGRVQSCTGSDAVDRVDAAHRARLAAEGVAVDLAEGARSVPTRRWSSPGPARTGCPARPRPRTPRPRPRRRRAAARLADAGRRRARGPPG